ncbi:MAG: hypothetical protein FJ265_16375 [Planctomycetes bacterium]|nr:hypothetical protein [Planctomycetota bacterium]
MRPALLLALSLSCPAVAQHTGPVGPPAPAPPTVPPLRVPEDPTRYAAAATAWFPALETTIEATPTDKEVKGVFPWRNPRGKPLAWMGIVGNCSCSMAVFLVGDRRYELRSKGRQLVQVTGASPEQVTVVETIPIGAGESGQVELAVDVQGAKAGKLVSLDLHTTDPEVPVLRLQVRVNVPQLVTVTPNDVQLGVVATGEGREFSATVTSARPDFVIRGHGALPKGVELAWERSERDGKPCWVVKGTFRPTDVGETHPVVDLQTNLPEVPAFHLRLHASVRAPVEVKPTLLAIGRVPRGKPALAKVTFTANDGRPLTAVALRVENTNVDAKFFTLRSNRDGANLVVEFEIGAGAPPGLFRGDLVVELDHPGMPQRRILFNGFVR